MTAPDVHHLPVLLEEVIVALNLDPAGLYVDATFGRGGHARALLARLGPAGRLVALDRDPAAVAAGQWLAAEDARFGIHHAPFSSLAAVLAGREANGILMDIGVSSPQLDVAERGFSFRQDGPLDMRMDPTRGEPASHWLAHAREEAIADVLWNYGEERFSRRIARRIVAERQVDPIVTTARLAAIVASAVPTRERGQHPATRSFQALRIHVNRELDELQSALPQAVAALVPGGRLAVISFHSLEDRIVKNFLRDLARPQTAFDGTRPPARLRLIGRACKPDAAACRANPRARSAVLRVAEKLP